MNATRTNLHPREETLSSPQRARPGLFQRGVLWLTLSALILQPVAVSAQVISATSGQYKPQVGTAQNGVTVVQITAPSGAGVSRNQYQQFDVTPQGVVLNNSQIVVQTQQAGVIEGNTNLVGGAARVILNEVMSNLPSNLRGYTEVGGQKAEVIIANPNGITCDGCGFINTSRGVLTTGAPVFGAGGSLDAFRVSAGNITINGAGLNGSNTDQIDLIARAVQVNAELWGKALNVVTGANQVAYADLATQTIAGSGAAPAVSIDVAALGGMYAGKIRLVSTEAGVGVVNAGTIAAQAGDLTLTSAGRLVLATNSTLTASNNINLAASGVTNAGTIDARQDLSINTQADVANTGAMTAGHNLAITAASLDSSGTLGAGVAADGGIRQPGNLSVAVSGVLKASGQNAAGGNISLSGATLDLSAANTWAGGDVTLTAGASGINHRAATLSAGGNVTLVSQGGIDNTNGRIEASNTLTAAAASIDNSAGSIVNFGSGLLRLNGGASVVNTGVIGGNGDVEINATQIANNHGKIVAGNDARVSTANLSGAGQVFAARDLTLSFSGNASNDVGSELKANRDLQLTAVGAFSNRGDIAAVRKLKIEAASLDNRAGATINAADTAITTSGAAQQIPLGGNLTNAGRIEGARLVITSADLSNSGTIIGDVLTINAVNLGNAGATAVIAATSSLDILISNALSNRDGATIYSLGDLNLGASTRRDADGYLADSMASFTNSSAWVQADGELRLSANQITNKRSVLDIQWSAERAGDYVGGNPYYTKYYTTEYVAAGTTPEGKLLSGSHMWLKGNILNEYSSIAAGGNLSYDAATLTQTGRALMEKESDRGVQDNWQYVKVGERCKWWGGNCSDVFDWRNYPIAYNQETTYQIGSVDATLSANNRLAGNAVNVNNQTVSSTNGSSATLGANGTASGSGATSSLAVPASGLFSYHSGPGYNYLIETDPRFASIGQFLSSDYMLSRLKLDPQQIQKRLGDGFVEQKLVADQILQQTGQRYLAGYANADTEFQALMESGLAASSSLNLRPGVALTASQLDALSKDIVWLVEQSVALPGGGAEKVLVPVVYLTRAHSVELKPNGALIAAADLDLAATGTLTNSGTLRGNNSLRLAAADILNRSGRIVSDGSTQLVADNDIVNQSGSIAGRQLTLVAGRDIRNERLTEAAQLGAAATTRIHDAATLSATAATAPGVQMQAGRDIVLAAGNITSASDIRVDAGRNLNVDAVSASEQIASGESRRGRQTQLASSLQSAGNLTLVAANDATLTAAQLVAGTDLTLAAGGNIALKAAKDSTLAAFDNGGSTKNRYYDESVKGSQLAAGGKLQIAAIDLATTDLNALPPTAAGRGNVSLEAATLKAGAGATIAADNSVSIVEASERHEAMQELRSKKSGFFSSNSSTDRTESSRSNVVGSLVSGDSVAIQTGADITVRASNIIGTKDVTLSAGRDIAIESAASTSTSSHFHEEKSSGFSASLTNGISIGNSSTTQADKAASSTAVASEISGNNVRLQAGRDATTTGSRVLADRDINVVAGRDVNILAAQNSSSEEHSFESKSTSLQLMGGLAPRQTLFSKDSASQTSQGQGNTATASLLSANAGNLSVTAGTDAQYANTGSGNVTSAGADIIARKDVRIEGNAVNLLASEANSQLDSQSQSKSVTIGAALAGTVGGQITRAYDMAKAAHDGTGNSRLDGAMALKAGYDAYKAIDGAGKAVAAAADGAAAANGAMGKGSAFGVSFSIGTSSSQSESHDQSHNERGTNLQADNIAVKARETDLTAVGAKIEAARDVTLEAARDLKLLAATNTQSLETSNKSSNASVGVTFGFGQQSGVSFQLGASQAKGRSEGSETTYDNTRVTAGETLALKSGGDTALKGAQVGGKRVEANIGGKLAIETLQDQSQYKSQQTSSGFSLSLCIPPICYGTSSGSISAAQQKIDHSYQSAVGQSGIAAGESGFDIKVGGDTKLKGGAITSTADATQNRLSTSKLSYEDLTNQQQTSASSYSLSLSGGMDVSKGVAPAPSTSVAGQAASNLLTNLGGQQGLPKSGDEQSRTLAVISPATITLTQPDDASQQAATTLTGRNPATANQALTNTLKLQDAARLQQQMKEAQQNAQAASLLGQTAAGLIGDLSTAMKKPVTDANLRQQLDEKQASGNALSNVERYELDRLNREGMSGEKAAQTLNDPAAQANYQNWQDGGANKIILHGLSGVLQAKVGNGSALVGATSGMVNEALLPAMSDYLESKGVKPGSEEYKGYMQLGSALLGAGIGALANGKEGAALGGTVAHNATTYNFLSHQLQNKREALRKKQKDGRISTEDLTTLIALDQADQRSDELLAKWKTDPNSLSDTQRQQLAFYLNIYAAQEGDRKFYQILGPRATSTGAFSSYGFPYAGTPEVQEAYFKANPRSFWGYITGTDSRYNNENRQLYDSANSQLLIQGVHQAQADFANTVLLATARPLTVAYGAYQLGSGGRAIYEGDYATGLANVGLGSLAIYGASAARSPVASAANEVKVVEVPVGANTGTAITNDVLAETRVGNGTKGQGSGNKVDQLSNKQVVGADANPIPVYPAKLNGPYATQEFPPNPVAHGFPDIIDNYASSATKFALNKGASLYQAPGTYNGAVGRFEWIVDPNLGGVTHRMFVPNGSINGIPVKP